MRASPRLRIVAACGLLAAACASSDAPENHFIDDFLADSPSARCETLPGLTARRGAVADLSPAGDTALLALFAATREAVLFRPTGAVIRTIPFAREGPTGVEAPVSATLVGDTLVYIADRDGHRLLRLDSAGRDRGRVRLDFPPQYVRSRGERTVVAPLVVGDTPSTLLFDLEHGSTHPLPIPPAEYTDITIHALANVLAPAVMPDGGIAAAHRMFVPAAYRAEAGGPIRRLPLPLPDGSRSALGYTPRTPVTDDELDGVLVAAIAMAPDPATGDLLYITRSGAGRTRSGAGRATGGAAADSRGAGAASGGQGASGEQGALGKAIIRVDSDFGYRSSHLLDVNGVRLGYTPDGRRSIIADEEGRWYTCHTP